LFRLPIAARSQYVGTLQIAPDLWRLGLPIERHSLGGANAYLIRDREGYALFDCGADVAECSAALDDQLAALGVPLDAVHTVVLSHGHGDHCGGANAVRERSGARTMLHERDAQFAGYPNVGGEPHRRQLVAWLAHYGFPDDEVGALIDAMTALDRQHEPIWADRLFVGGEVLELGDYRFEVLWTPGHTPGHVCLYDPTKRILLCGDHILEVVAPNVGFHPLSDGNPLPGYLNSLRDLASREIDVTLPGHGAPIADLARPVAELVRRQQDRQSQLLSLMTTAPQTAYALASQVWAQRGRRNWSGLQGHLRRNAVGTVVAHVELLAERGDIVRSEDGAVGYRLVR